MTDSPAYYDLSGDSERSKLPAGNYDAIIVDMSTVTDIKCGLFIADIFKPVYRIIDGEHKDMEVIDNGFFRYKQVNGYEYESNKNWGFAKFMQLLGTYSKKDGKVNLPYITKRDVSHKRVRITVWDKSFINETSDRISYPVARAVSLINEVPF